MVNYNKHLLDAVFVISRIIKVEVRVISRRLKLITFIESGYHKKPNLIIVLLYFERQKKKWKSCFLLFHWWEATQSVRPWHDYPKKSCTALIRDMITRDLECPWHDYCTSSFHFKVKCCELKVMWNMFMTLKKHCRGKFQHELLLSILPKANIIINVSEEWSSLLIFQLKQLERKTLKKNMASTRVLRDTGAMLYQLNYEDTHWGRGQFIEFISPVKSEMTWNI